LSSTSSFSVDVDDNNDYCDPKTHVYIQDQGGDDSTVTTNNDMIPSTLYQIGISRCVLREVYEQGIHQWMKLVDSKRIKSYRFIDDFKMNEYLNQERWRSKFPGLQSALHCIDNWEEKIMKSDVWRYLFLWEYGGIYADLDTVPQSKLFVDFRSIINNSTVDAWFIQSIHFEWGITPSQWFFAIKPHHPILYKAIQLSIHNILLATNANPLQQTGPVTLMRATEIFLHPHQKANQLRPGIIYENDLQKYNFQVLSHRGYVDHFSFPTEIKERMYNEHNQQYYYTTAEKKKNSSNTRCVESFVGGRVVIEDDNTSRIMINHTVLSDSSKI
jgi:mannosyltransferase OCH1-like enzyme